MRKGEVEIILTKEGCKDIKVTCPAKVKMHPLVAFMTIQYGLPPMQVKPVDWKGVGLALLLFGVIFASCLFFLVNIALGIIAVVATFAININFNRNYFFNYIQKKLREGYQVTDQEQQQILTEAGVLPLAEKASSGFKFPFPANINVSKQKLLGIAGGAVAIIFVLAMCTGVNIIDSALDDMEDTVVAMEKIVTKLESGKMSSAEAEFELGILAEEFIMTMDSYGDEDVQPTSEQMKRANQLLNRMEKASTQATMHIYYY